MKHDRSCALAALLIAALPIAPAAAQDTGAVEPAVAQICLAPASVEAAL